MAIYDEVHYYGQSPLQYLLGFYPTMKPAPTGNAALPVFICLNAAGFSSYIGMAEKLASKANQLTNWGPAFIINYQSTVAPGATLTLTDTAGTVVPPSPAFPAQIDDVVSGVLWILKHVAGSPYYGDTNSIHLVGGSAGGTLVALASARLSEIGIRVASCHTLSSNTDWYSTIQFYVDLGMGNNGLTADAATASNHLNNIANNYGVASGWSQYQTGGYNNSNSAFQYTLLWHTMYQTALTNGLVTGNEALDNVTRFYNWNSNYWSPGFFSQFSPAQRCANKSNKCWYHIIANILDIEIPIEQAYVFLDALTNVGTMATVNALCLTGTSGTPPHAYDYWDTAGQLARSIANFALASAK